MALVLISLFSLLLSFGIFQGALAIAKAVSSASGLMVLNLENNPIGVEAQDIIRGLLWHVADVEFDAGAACL